MVRGVGAINNYVISCIYSVTAIQTQKPTLTIGLQRNCLGGGLIALRIPSVEQSHRLSSTPLLQCHIHSIKSSPEHCDKATEFMAESKTRSQFALSSLSI